MTQVNEKKKVEGFKTSEVNFDYRKVSEKGLNKSWCNLSKELDK